ncbi:MAG: formylglycine-generating enzyme family protein [Polyangiaceae bacterium]|nr:formylglycine-generating enzyme family protein [Polyangiaceae bacterium]
MTPPQRTDDEAQLARIAPRGRQARALLLTLGGPFLLVAFIIGGRLLLPVKELRLAPLVPFEAGVADEAPRALLDAPLILLPAPPASARPGASGAPLAPFALDPTEVTVRNFRICVEARRCAVESDLAGCNWGKPGREDHPMNCVDWNEADIYCRWLGRRLPTEEEWEWAARGAEGRVYPWGNDPAITEHACVARGETCAVGSFPGGATPQGLQDLAGNVWEWTSSPYCPADRPGCDTAQRAVRGGSYSVREAARLKATIRSGHPVTLREHYLGFRCARDGTPAPPAR